MGEQTVPWAEGRLALIIVEDDWLIGEGMLSTKGRKCWTFRGHSPVYIEEVDALPIPGQCRQCFGVGGHTPDCPVPAREAVGVPRWLAPFVREAPPPLACQKSYQVYQVYHRGMEQMFSADGVAWHTEAGEPFEPTALGWVCFNDDGPTVAPWGEP